MGETVRLKAPDGHEPDAYVAAPAGAPKGGIVLIQEAFGVTDHIRSVCDTYAAAGYLVVSPALYDRVERGVELTPLAPDGFERAAGYRKQITDDNIIADVAAGLDRARQAGKVAVMGYCIGGTFAWQAAQALPFDAAACFYGGGLQNLLDPPPRCPVIVHYGAKDERIPLSEADAVKAAALPGVVVYIYEDAEHAFNNDTLPHRYHEPSARLARERTLAFYAEHCGG